MRAQHPPADDVEISEASDAESESSSSSEDVTEDEDGLELTPALDAAILRTLNKIRRGEGVYGQERVLDQELQEAQLEAEKRGVRVRESRKTQDKPYLLADHQREALLSGLANEYDDEEDDRRESLTLTHVQAQAKLRKEVVSAFHALDDDDEDDEDGGFQPVKVGGDGAAAGTGDEDEDAAADREYRKFLLEMGGGEDQVRSLLQPEAASGARPAAESGNAAEGLSAPAEGEKKRRKKGKKAEAVPLTEEQKAAHQAKKAVADEDFLMDYILNRGWVDRGEVEDRKSKRNKKHAEEETDGILGGGAESADGGAEAGPSHPWGKIDEEDEFDNMAERFEAEYNFRYEEPGSSNIITHPRQIPSLVRRADDSRATKRAARAERKAAEKAAKEEDLRRLKGQKRREMEKQLESLKREVGDGVDWTEIERVLEGDFDEREWERTLEKMIGAMSGDADGADGDDDDVNEKPVWDDLGDEYYDGASEDEQAVDEDLDAGPINMDADHLDEPKSRKGKKNKGKGKSASRADAAEADSDDDEDGHLTIAEKAEKVRQAMEAYHALDHEDMIGDMPTRFKYTRSEPVDYGLTPAEMLLATDAELNTILSMKQLAPYRQAGGVYGRQGKGLAKRVRELKERLRRRKWGEENDDAEGDEAFGAGGRTRDAGWGQRSNGGAAASSSAGAGASTSANGDGAKRPGKRLGRKERNKLRAANGDAAPEPQGQPNAAGQKRSADAAGPEGHEQGEGETEGGKRKRRKKRHAKGVIEP